MAKKYVVKKGDNLKTLADKLGVSMEEIQSTNGIRNLTPGQTLKVPTTRVGVGEVSNPLQGANNSYTAAQGVYSTGENERRTINVNGENVRLAPNSTIDTRIKPANPFQQFMDAITGRAQNSGGLESASVGRSLAGIPLQNYNNTQYSPSQLQQIGTLNPPQNSYAMPRPGIHNVAAGMGGYITDETGRNPVSKGVNGLQSPVAYNRGNGLGTNSQMGGIPPFYQGAYDNPYQPNPYQTKPYQMQQQNQYPVSTYRAPGQFSYAPQGQPNSYTPYSPPQAQAAPFLTSQMQANPTYGNALPAPQPEYGSYAPGNKLYSGQAKTAQEAYQQGNRNIDRRRWIGRGRNGGGGDNGAALAQLQAQQQALIDDVKSQGHNKQQVTWRA